MNNPPETSRYPARIALEQAVAAWRAQHDLRDDDAVMLLMELLAIHQRHWDELRRDELPSFEPLRADLSKSLESTRALRCQLDLLGNQLKTVSPHPSGFMVTRAAAVWAAVAGAMAGYMFAKTFP